MSFPPISGQDRKGKPEPPSQHLKEKKNTTYYVGKKEGMKKVILLWEEGSKI